MQPRSRLAGHVALLAGAALLGAPPAAAFVHLWNVSEVYSSADGSVQFVELLSGGSGELGFSLAALESDANTVAGFSDLTGNTLNRRVLIATEGFADLPGGVEPDFVLPASFFDLEGDTLVFRAENFAETWDTWTFPAVPVDGALSLHRDNPSASNPPQTFSIADNSPTNYAGAVGHVEVPEPRADALRLLAAATLLALARGRRATRRVQRPAAAPRDASTLQMPGPRAAMNRNTQQ
jgi:hypothetical protein